MSAHFLAGCGAGRAAIGPSPISRTAFNVSSPNEKEVTITRREIRRIRHRISTSKITLKKKKENGGINQTKACQCIRQMIIQRKKQK